mgnify:CR=1 FL=1
MGDYETPGYSAERGQAFDVCKEQLSALANSKDWYGPEQYMEQASRILEEKLQALAELKKSAPSNDGKLANAGSQ